MSRRDDLNKLLTIKQRRLQKLNEQAAVYSINTPPHISIEIEDIEAEIEQIQTDLAALDAGGPSTGEGDRSRPDQLSDPPDAERVAEPGGDTREETPADQGANLREQLNQTFDDQALAVFCLEHYPAVYKQFRAGLSKQEKIERLVRYCENQGMLDQLAAAAH